MDSNKTFFKKAKQEQVGFWDIFSGIFRRHTKEENARLFLAGTALTTPDDASMLGKWTKPYMFARVWLVGVILVWGCTWINRYLPLKQDLLTPFAFVAGSFIFPLAWLLFFWEMNIPRNISFVQALTMLFVGGGLSLFFTGLLNMVPVSVSSAVSVYTMVGIVEELGKLLPALPFIRKKDTKYILTGMLVGAAVGAGFSAIESAGYNIVETGWSMGNLKLRAILSLGGHIGWAALSVGALVWAKGDKELCGKHLMDARFLGWLVFSMATHAIWDIFCDLINYFCGLWGLLLFQSPILIAVFWMLRKGLRQVTEASMRANEERLTYALDHDFMRQMAAAVEPGAADAGGNGGQGNPAPVNPIPGGDFAGGQVPGGISPGVPAPDGPAVDTGLRLQGISGVYGDRRFALQGKVRIGTDPARNDLVYQPGTPGISRAHCEVWITGGKAVLMDCGSTYGTYVNGQRLSPGQPCELRTGDTVSLGSPNESFRLALKGGRVS